MKIAPMQITWNALAATAERAEVQNRQIVTYSAKCCPPERRSEPYTGAIHTGVIRTGVIHTVGGHDAQ